MTGVERAAARVAASLSAANQQQCRRLAAARAAGSHEMYLPGQTFDVKVPRYLMADLLAALDEAAR